MAEGLENKIKNNYIFFSKKNSIQSEGIESTNRLAIGGCIVLIWLFIPININDLFTWNTKKTKKKRRRAYD